MPRNEGTKFHKNDKLTREQRRQIAFLVNAGIPYAVLARDFKVCYDTIHMIAYQRSRFMPAEDIARIPDEKLRFAQRFYHITDQAIDREYIESYVFRPLANHGARNSGKPTLRESLAHKILDITPQSEITSIENATYSELMGKIRNGKKYSNLQKARADSIKTAKKFRQQQLPKPVRDLVEGGIEKIVSRLGDDEAQFVQANFSLNGTRKSLRDLAREYNVSHEYIRQSINEAIQSMRHDYSATLRF